MLVTGCCGYLGVWITVALLRAGFAVRGTSREPDQARALHDEALAGDPTLRARLTVVPGELLDAGSWRGAADGCSAVIHTACPVATEVGTPPAQMHDPALVGTENVMREAARAGTVERVVYLSSVVTLLDHHRPPAAGTGPETVGPADWNDTATPATDPYAHAKVLAERRARALTTELMPRATFASILPGPVLGPPVAGRRIPASVDKTLAPLLTGQLRMGSVDMHLGLVDARDVAAVAVALVRAPDERLRALGDRARFVCAADPAPRIQDVADALAARFPAYAKVLPRRALPAPPWMLLALMRLAVTREAYTYTRAMLGRRVRYDNTLTREVLGVACRPWRDSVVETVAWLDARGLRTSVR